MEESRRKLFQKHLQPARPLRRCSQVAIEPKIFAATGAQAQNELVDQETNIGIEQFCKIVNLQRNKKGRTSYTRDFLIGLARCPEAMKKPEFLPDHPIVLTMAVDPGPLMLHEIKGTVENEEMVAERRRSS